MRGEGQLIEWCERSLEGEPLWKRQTISLNSEDCGVVIQDSIACAPFKLIGAD